MSRFPESIQHLEPFATAFLDCDSDNISLKIANGMLNAARHLPLKSSPQCAFPCATWENDFGVVYLFGGGISINDDLFKKEAEDHPEAASQLKEIHDLMKPCSTGEYLQKVAFTDLDKKFRANNTGWGGGWGGHSNPDYQMLLELGVDGLRQRLEKYRPQHPEAATWYDACSIALDALEIIGERARAFTEQLAETTEDKELAKLYLRMSRAFANVPRRPAEDFLEACCSFYLVFSFDGRDSPGRFDQYMFNCYRKSDPEDSRLLLEHIWNGFQIFRSWNLCLSGSDANGKDQTNELTYEILSVARKFRFNTPNITLRCHRNTPDKLREAVHQTLATGIGMPALYNDETVCPALEQLGIPPEDSHNYCMNGCNQIDIQGKSHMGLEDGEISVIKCLEYALFNGVCQYTHELIAPQTGDPRAFASFEQLFDAYKKQLDWATEVVVASSRRSQQVYGEHEPNPLRSNLIQGCIEKGRDYKCGGPIYNHGQILTEGLADAADSLAAIKHFVYDTHELTMDQLLYALASNFKDNEPLRLKLRAYPAKFGNDIPEVDNIAREIIRHHYTDMMKYRTWRDPVNGIFGGGLSTFQRTARYGSTLGATASGRLAGDPNLADSISAVPGFDVNGPTAAIKSALAYDHKLAKSGFVFQIKFAKDLFVTPQGHDGFITLWKTFFQEGGQQMTVNVVDAEALKAAQKEPDKYRDLIVRVGGYSAYFVTLPENLQNNVIARTLY